MLIVSVALVLSYGFYATHYTFHVDQLVSESYEGTVLIGAGRWSAPLIHLLTSWMDYAPFWHTAVMGILLFLASVVWCVLFQEASGGKISDYAALVFSVLFVSSPALKSQITYPVLNLALAFILVPVALYYIMYASLNKEKQVKHLLIAVALLIVSVDLYEAFAAVFMVGLFAVLMLLWLYHGTFQKTFRASFFFVLRAVCILAAAIAVDIILSKLICLILCSTTEYWYNVNNYIVWGTKSVIKTIKLFVRSMFVTYVIGSTKQLIIALFLFTSVCGFGLFGAVSIRRKSAIPILLYLGLLGSTFLLPLIEGTSVPMTQILYLPVFIGAVWMFVLTMCGKKRVLSVLLSVLIAVMVFNQTKDINNYAVEHYERFSYEMDILRDVGKEITKYSETGKPVAFFASEKMLSNDLSGRRENGHPVVKAYSHVLFTALDLVIPTGYYTKIGRQYTNETISSAQELADCYNIDFPAYWSFLKWARYGENYFKALERLGYPACPCTEEEQEAAKQYLIENDSTRRFAVFETPDVIVVQFMEVKEPAGR